jgi:hypothetical protein
VALRARDPTGGQPGQCRLDLLGALDTDGHLAWVSAHSPVVAPETAGTGTGVFAVSCRGLDAVIEPGRRLP